MSQKIYESYKWIVPFETGTVQGKKVIIRGKALHATVSANLRKYVKEELERSARSLAQKYIDVNHEYSVWMANKSRYDKGETASSPGLKPKLKGNVIDSEFEEGFIEYVGEVNAAEYVDKLIDREKLTEDAYIKKYGKHPIRGVSVDATYRFHREKDGSLEPHGIIFNGLSLVEDPEKAGVEGTTLEVLEIRETQQLDVQFKILQNLLGEMNVITEVVEKDGERFLEEKAMERKEVKTIVETDEERAKKELGLDDEGWRKLAPATRLNLMQNHPNPRVAAPQKPTPLVPEDSEQKEQKHIVIEQVNDEVKDKLPLEEIKVGHLDLKFPTPIEVEMPEPWDKYILPKDEYVKKYGLEKWEREVQHLGEPFADYRDFKDCVAKNQDKDDPEAYCGSIKHKVEGETATATLVGKIGELKREHQREVMAKSIAHLASKAETFEKTFATFIAEAHRRDIAFATVHNALLESITANMLKFTEFMQAQSAKSDKAIKVVDEKLELQSGTLSTKIGELSTTFIDTTKTLRTDFDKAVTGKVAEVEAKVTALKELNLSDKVSVLDTKLTALESIKINDKVLALESKLSTLDSEKLGEKITALEAKVTLIDTDEAQMKEIREMFTKLMDEKGREKKLTETQAESNMVLEGKIEAQGERIKNMEERMKKPDFKVSASATEIPSVNTGVPKPVGRQNPSTG